MISWIKILDFSFWGPALFILSFQHIGHHFKQAPRKKLLVIISTHFYWASFKKITGHNFIFYWASFQHLFGGFGRVSIPRTLAAGFHKRVPPAHTLGKPTCKKHRKNYECCHHHSVFKGHNVIVHIVVLNCQNCSQSMMFIVQFMGVRYSLWLEAPWSRWPRTPLPHVRVSLPLTL